MTRVADGVGTSAVKKVMTPPLSTLPVYDTDADERAFEALRNRGAAAPVVQKEAEVDDWELLVTD